MTPPEDRSQLLTEWADSFADRCQYGPGYRRAVHTHVTDAFRSLRKGDLDAAAYWLRLAGDADLFAETGEQRTTLTQAVAALTEAGEGR